jgi:branched-chain amino acid transport system permease protein
MAGFAGSLFAHHATYVHPGSFGFHHSIYFVIMAVLGGMASVWGAVFGAGAVTLISENLRWRPEFSPIVFGAVLVAIMIFMPSGLWRGTGDLLRRAAKLGWPSRTARRRTPDD